MRTYESDKNGSDVKKDHCNQSVSVPANIENKPVIPNIIH